MANINESLASLMDIDGAGCAAIVDSNSGMLLGSMGSGMDIAYSGRQHRGGSRQDAHHAVAAAG